MSRESRLVERWLPTLQGAVAALQSAAGNAQAVASQIEQLLHSVDLMEAELRDVGGAEPYMRVPADLRDALRRSEVDRVADIVECAAAHDYARLDWLRARAAPAEVPDPFALPPDPPRAGGDRELLEAFLDYQRAVVRRKLRGLTRQQAVATPTASSLSALTIVKHLTGVERWWFQHRLAGWDVARVRDEEFVAAPDDTVEGVLEAYEHACAASRTVSAGLPLDSPGARDGYTPRWVLLHLIEETARHLGHLDLIREALDGQTGD